MNHVRGDRDVVFEVAVVVRGRGGSLWSIWPAYEMMRGNPKKLSDPLLPVSLPFNVSLGHQRNGDAWLPSPNGSRVRSEGGGSVLVVVRG